MSAGILSAKVLQGKDLDENSQAILRVTDGWKHVCTCSHDAMVHLFGAARASGTETVEGVAVFFLNAMDIGEQRPLLASGILSAKALQGHDLQANSQVILRVCDPDRWVCVCSDDAMIQLFGAARAVHTEFIENTNMTFLNWQDVGNNYP